MNCMDCIDLDQDKGQLESPCKCCNVPSDSIKCGEFLNNLRNFKLLKKDSVARSR